MTRAADHYYDRIAEQYLDALDRDDWGTVASIWREAETDPALERALIELVRELTREP